MNEDEIKQIANNMTTVEIVSLLGLTVGSFVFTAAAIAFALVGSFYAVWFLLLAVGCVVGMFTLVLVLMAEYKS